MGEEIELKLTIEPEALAAVLKAAPLTSRGIRFARARHLVTTYYDTQKGALKNKGVYLRIRQAGARIEQTVKTDGDGGILARRGEWNWPLKEAEPDLELASSTGLKSLVKRARKGGLVKRFTSEIDRRVAIYETQDAVLELALDKGVVRAGRRTAPVLELELEVKRGDALAVFELAREILGLPGVAVGFVTKAGRGFELVEGRTRAAEKATEHLLAPDMPPHEAAREILNTSAAHIAANLSLLRETGAAEAIHQSRVGLRRLRAALGLLKDALPAEARKHLQREAGWLAGALGAARDFDVLVMGALAAAKPAPDLAPALSALVRRVSFARRAARLTAREAAVSARAQYLLLDLAEMATKLAPITGAPDLKAIADMRLQARYETVLKAGEGIEALDVEARHDLRLALKKLRYAADIFASLYPHKAVRAEIKALARLQDALGAFNDAAVVPQIAASALAVRGKPPAETVTAAAFLGGWAAHQAESAWNVALARWRGFTQAKPFWGEGL